MDLRVRNNLTDGVTALSYGGTRLVHGHDAKMKKDGNDV
jgi:hypothetical protein